MSDWQGRDADVVGRQLPQDYDEIDFAIIDGSGTILAFHTPTSGRSPGNCFEANT